MSARVPTMAPEPSKFAPPAPTAESPTVDALAPLLAPIREDAPSGDWLYYDRVYDLLREARREEDPSLPRGIWKRELKRSNWSEVVDLATAALSTRTKDLQIAAWLLEAWTKQHGFGGALRGFQLIQGLCTRYWEDIYPRPDGEDQSARVLVIEWLNENLVLMLQSIPLTKPADVESRIWSWSDRVEALRAENLVLRGAKTPPSPGSDVLTSAKMFSSIIATPRAFFVQLRDELAGCLEAVRAVEEFFDAQFGATAPSLTRVLESVKTIHQWAVGVLAQHVTEDKTGTAPLAPDPLLADSQPEPVDATTEDSMQTPTPAPAPVMADHSRARADAYRKLAEAAHTLMRIEPHSPTPYLVFRAIAWGEMSLAELMRHFISSGYDLKSLYAMLGMEEKKP
jgi:type VI secretion system protein ImpA